MLSGEQCARLVESFTEADYSVEAVIGAVGADAHRALGRNQTVPADRALDGRFDPLATLIRLWLLQQPVPVGALDRALPGLRLALVRAGILVEDGAEVRAVIDLRPYATEDRGYWICADLTPGLDGVVHPTRPDLVVGASSASTTLVQLTPRDPVTSALDLGTGCGVQSLHLAAHAGSIVATDVNPRALRLAELTFLINSIEVDLRQGDLYAPVAGQRFELITTNPPYVIAPPADGPRLTYRDAGLAADLMVERVVRSGTEHLIEGGLLCVLGNWAHRRGQTWEDRLAGWIPAGCDAHVLQRELLDPSEYAEIWLADAGLAGSPGYRRRYAGWLDYFDSLGIEAVGLGWLVVQRTGSERPAVRVEHWPHPVEQPVAAGLARERDGRRHDRDHDDQTLLAARWLIGEDVVQEAIGPPGAADPAHLVLRQQRGLQRAVEVGTALAGVVGACDGELPLGVVVDAVAALLGVEPAALRADLTPKFRRLVAEGYLIPAQES